MVRCVLLCHGKFIRYICLAKLLKTFLINYSGRLKSGNTTTTATATTMVACVHHFEENQRSDVFIRLSLLYVSVGECFFSLARLLLPLHSLLSCYHIPRRFLALCLYACQECVPSSRSKLFPSRSFCARGTSFTMIFWYLNVWNRTQHHCININKILAWNFHQWIQVYFHLFFLFFLLSQQDLYMCSTQWLWEKIRSSENK